MTTTTFIYTLAIPLLTSPLVYLVGRLIDRAGKPRLRSLVVRFMALAALLAAWISYSIDFVNFNNNEIWLFNIEAIWLKMDGLSLLLGAAILGLGTLVVIYSGVYMAEEEGEEKYYAMLLAMIGVMLGLCCASDLFNLWVWFEAMAVSSYLLVAFYRQLPASLEAGIKYLVQSTVGSILVMFGIALVLAQTGTLDLVTIAKTAAPSPALLAAGAFFTIGFGVKIAIVPMHTWLPDAHSQAPSGISAMLSGVVIETALVALLRVLTSLLGVSNSWGIVLIVFGMLNMLYGNLLALRQQQVKRMLAYSSLVHVGYILVGVGITLFTHQTGGAQGAFFHLINHSLMKGLAFLSAGALIYTFYIASGSHAPLTISDLAGASRRYPLTALSLSLALLGLAGLPPLAGFMSKWQIFLAGFNTQNPFIIGAVIFAALNSVLSLAYYAPLINAMYRQKPSDVVNQGVKMPLSMVLPLVLMAAAIVLLGFVPNLLDNITIPASQALLRLGY